MPKMSKGKIRSAAKPFRPRDRTKAEVPGTKDRTPRKPPSKGKGPVPRGVRRKA